MGGVPAGARGILRRRGPSRRFPPDPRARPPQWCPAGGPSGPRPHLRARKVRKERDPHGSGEGTRKRRAPLADRCRATKRPLRAVRLLRERVRRQFRRHNPSTKKLEARGTAATAGDEGRIGPAFFSAGFINEDVTWAATSKASAAVATALRGGCRTKGVSVR